MLRPPTRPPIWALLSAGAAAEIGWLAVSAASIRLSEACEFTAAFVRQFGPLTSSIRVGCSETSAGSEPAPLLIGGLLAVTLGYLAAIGVLLRWPDSNLSRWSIGVMLVFAATLLLMPGLFSGDILTYAAYGRMAALEGLNPYATSPISAPADAVIQSLVDHASPYGPLWTFLSVAIARLTAAMPAVEQVLAFRVVGLAAHVMNAFLIYRLVPHFAPVVAPVVAPLGALLERPRAQRLALLIYAWNPLVLLELVGSAHNDGFMMTFVLAGLLMLARQVRWWAAGVVLWMGVLVKWVPIVLVFYLVVVWIRRLPSWRARALHLACVSAGAVLLTLVAFAPWIDLQTPNLLLLLKAPVNTGDRYVNALVDLPTVWLASHWLDRYGVDLRGTEAMVRTWSTTAVRVLFLAYILLEIRGVWNKVADLQAIVETTTRTLLVALLVAFTQVLAWYFVWPMALGATLGWRSVIGKIALAYSILYLPLFYATREYTTHLRPLDAPVLLVVYALLPLLIPLIDRHLRLHWPFSSMRLPGGAPG